MWKLKLDDKGQVVVQDGKPVYVDDAGKDIAFDAFGAYTRISELNSEAKGHREAKEKAEAALKKFDGITDPAAAMKALETLKGLDSKELIAAGKVEEIRLAAVKTVEEKYAPIVAENDKLKGALRSEKIGGAFARSKFVADKLAIPPDIVEARFGSHFSLDEQGQVIVKDQHGNQLYSKANPGRPANFDEALELLVDQYQYKANILKGAGHSGSGAQGGSGGSGGAKTTTREQWDAMSQQERMTFSKAGGKIEG